ncbi:furin-like protease 2 [Planococcus citri]|uniref:furin-like protease 2 n=1 Tax=Planococcus citri TaxID=170843 RepID=UPI0031F7504F
MRFAYRCVPRRNYVLEYLFDVLKVYLFLCVCVCVAKRQPLIYMNQFAVHVPTGHADADHVASTHGFQNLGQIGSLKGFYLFEHAHVHKRSTSASDTHHELLKNHPLVHWVEQQHEKKRKKRDFTSFDNTGPVVDYSYYDPTGLQRQLGPLGHYRGPSQHNVFPDPLFKEQWYLNGGAKDGFDMNVGPAWQKGYTGKGVVVSILDDGIQTNHPDLALNYDPQASTDINDNDDNPMPRDNGDNKHGTRCAGEVAGVAFNQYCGVGVAYNASIGGVRMLDGTVNDAVEARALGLNINHIDIYSASWGPEDDGKTVDGPGPLARRAFIYGVTSGRHGKGSIFVWASGNGGRHTDCCNCDGYTNSIFTLSISSATQGGYKPWYLEECASTLATTYSSGTPGHDKSIGTVDMDGRLRPDHICTVEHTGTSASAPLAAGLVALALEANPNLTWRDMQYIVVITSKSLPLEKESGWALNGVKRKFNHKFGYGLMDGEAMVNLAEQWTNVPMQHICKSQEINEDRPIDSNPGSVLTAYMDVNGCPGTLNEVRFLEHIQCKISLRFFPRGNLKIDLTSPMGTTSTLLFERPRDVVSSNFDDWPFLSVHFWGEKAEGRWTLKIHNNGNRHINQPGILKRWQLIFYGTATNPIRLKSIQSPSQPIPFAIQQPQARSSSFPFNNQYLPSSNIGEIINQPGFRNIPDIFASGSEPEGSVVSVASDRPNRPGQIIRSMEGRRILHDCDPECDPQGCYGKGPTHCVACKRYKLDNTCVSRCPPRSFPNQGGFCWPCHESCETCAGAGQDSCLTCAPAHLRVTDLAVCLQQCPEGYFENQEERTCVPCESNCASCQDRPDHCTSCHHNLVLSDNKCLATCPLNTYETDSYRCEPCSPNCETCTGPSDNCTTCKIGFFELGKKCYEKCPAGYYGDSKRRECLLCPPNCLECDTTGIKCKTCKEGYVIDSDFACVTIGSELCKIGEYAAPNDTCSKCHTSCETCSDGSDSGCLSCPSATLLESNKCVRECSRGFFNTKDGCTPCMHTCEECISRTNCSKCRSPLLLQSGECRTSCANGYYNDLGSCAKCFLSCTTCSGPRRDQCVTCPRGWQLAAGECHPECPQGFFMSDFGCQKCHHYCRTCKGEGPLQCTSCPPHFMLESGLCMECLGSQYYDPPTQLCKPCHSSCTACDGPGAFSCIACTYPLRLDKSNKQCVPCCTERTTTGCCNCDTNNGECKNTATAGKRRIASQDGDTALALSSPHKFFLQLSATTLISVGCIGAILLFLLMFAFVQIKNKDPRGNYEKLLVQRQRLNRIPYEEDEVEQQTLIAST